MALTKIGSIGINTGIAFAGVTTIATLNGSDAVLSVGGTVNFVSDVSIGGTVSIAGTLTYEDVTNVDAVGLITARDGIKVGSGVTLSVDGDIFATGVTTSTTFVGNLTGNVTGDVTGNADSATSATNSSHVLVTDNESTNENNLITFVEDATSSTGNVGLEMDGDLTYNPSTGTVSATVFSDSKGNLRSIPANSQSGAYVAVAADAGKAIYISTGGVTINDSVFSAGDAVTIINNSGSNQTITQGSGVTLYNAADATTGNRTLAGRGMATIWFISAGGAYISGAGLS